jgi:hypothetical protein
VQRTDHLINLVSSTPCMTRTGLLACAWNTSLCSRMPRGSATSVVAWCSCEVVQLSACTPAVCCAAAAASGWCQAGTLASLLSVCLLEPCVCSPCRWQQLCWASRWRRQAWTPTC